MLKLVKTTTIIYDIQHIQNNEFSQGYLYDVNL